MTKRDLQKTLPSSSRVDPANRMNDLDSQRWLTFQKSWFTLAPHERATQTAAEFILFFTKRLNDSERRSRVGIFQENAAALAPVITAQDREAIVLEPSRWNDDDSEFLALDYLLVDLCGHFPDEAAYEREAPEWSSRLRALARQLKPKAYLTIFMRNRDDDGRLLPLAWLFGKTVAEFLTIKDEKIGCETPGKVWERTKKQMTPVRASASENEEKIASPPAGIAPEAHDFPPRIWKTRQNFFYCLNFRREEGNGEKAPETAQHSSHQAKAPELNSLDLLSPIVASSENFKTKIFEGSETALANQIQRAAQTSWFVPKPPPREKGVLLHPAKFPEPLVKFFLDEFSQEGERVFDPMAGTGSTLLSALSCGREAYGIELNPQFHRIATERIERYLPSLPGLTTSPKWKLVCGDAADENSYHALTGSFDYILTSPPYWDMLRMKGAETQQKRKQAGLLQFYSDDERDLGNKAAYDDFLESLVRIYERVAARLAPGRYMTVVVKNVKKRGKIYPLAWDLALRLSKNLALCHEQFWCQDDQRLAPFGYRYAWVSNTFHHYCLHFRKAV